jgi:hypothetical protein
MLGGLTDNSSSALGDMTSGGMGGLSNPTSASGSPTDYLGGDMLSGGSGAMGGDMLSGMGSGAMGGDMLSGMGSGAMGGGGLDQASSSQAGESAGAASEGSGVESGKKPVVILSHGMGASGGSYAGLARQFEQAGYHVETPTDTMSPFDGSGAVDAYRKLEAQNNPNLDLENVILVGHSAGGSAAQLASAELGDNVAGVIAIDGAQPMGQTNTDVPHAFFRHSGDMLGAVVGSPNPSVPGGNRTQETLPGTHMTAIGGSDAENYIEAANQMLGR